MANEIKDVEIDMADFHGLESQAGANPYRVHLSDDNPFDVPE